MSTPLPAAIAAYLEEAGFSATEMLILTKLVEGDSFTIRELGTLTGKSPGVLDPAMKKLLTKKIARKELINDQPRYSIQSLDAVLKWVDEDRKVRKATLDRRHQDFESFIHTLSVDRKRPEMRHFAGEEGIVQAYRELLNLGQEMLHYCPITTKAEDDPLREFRVAYFSERRRRGIFSRVIAHDTPLGRRFQSRDPFEYRETKLVAEHLLPFTFEKIIAGDTIACINHAEKKACIMHYPELAETERGLFESIWQHGLMQGEASQGAPVPPPPSQKLIPLSTRALSSLRDFFVKPRSIAILVGLGVLSGVLTYVFYLQSATLSFKRMQDQVRSIATTAVFQFDPNDIEKLQVESDWKKSEWAKVVNQLKQIRLNNENVFFVYMFRRSAEDPHALAFVADSHSINPYANTDDDPANNVDVDQNGVIDSIDVLQWPGQPYPPPQEDVFLAFDGPRATDRFYEDSWGKYVTGYAPIKNAEGESIAVLAVDMQAGKLRDLTRETFAPLLSFFLLFFIFVTIRLAAFNKSLFRELWKVLNVRSILASLALCAILAMGVTYGAYRYTLHLTKLEIGDRLMSIAATAAPEIDAADLENLHFARDMKSDAYQRVFGKLNEIRDQNSRIQYAYIMRPAQNAFDDPRLFEFVADADSNYFALPQRDRNGDGKLDELAEPVAPGHIYDTSLSNSDFFQVSMTKPMAETDFYTDQWGTYISGSAPIRDEQGNAVAVLGFDMDVSDVYLLTKNKFEPWFWFLGTLTVLTLFAFFVRRWRDFT